MQQYLRWANPEMLNLLWLVPLMAALYVYAARARLRTLRQIASASALDRLAPATIRRRRRLRAALMTGALALLVIAAARPQFGTSLERVERRGVDVIFAVDTSKSMLARDVSPDRLTAAREIISGMVGRMRGDRVGIVAFAGDAFLYCPLTTDYGALRMFLDALDTNVVGTPGTAIAPAIEVALSGFEAAEHTHHHLIIITDGEDHGGGAVEATGRAVEQGLTIHVVAIGEPEGAPIPEIGLDGTVTGHRTGPDGEIVLSRPNRELARELATVGGGTYASVSGAGIPVEPLFSAVQRDEGRLVGTYQFQHYEERYQIPLGVAMLLIAVAAVIGDRGRHRS